VEVGVSELLMSAGEEFCISFVMGRTARAGEAGKSITVWPVAGVSELLMSAGEEPWTTVTELEGAFVAMGALGGTARAGEAGTKSVAVWLVPAHQKSPIFLIVSHSEL
jgi:hypothetical protein